jgi:polysaccharide pyruvyl transferase WcaK-like protein
MSALESVSECRTELRAKAHGRKYAILGYYGHGNFGDDLLARAVIPLVLQRVTPQELLVSAPRNCYIEDWFPGVRCVPLRWSTRHEYESVEKVVLGGGGLFFAFRSRNPFQFFGLLHSSICGLHLHLASPQWRRRTHKYAFCVGVGPLDAPFSRRLAASYLASFDHVAVRDTESASIVARCGLTNAVVATDAAVGVASQWLSAPPTDRDRVGIVVRHWAHGQGGKDILGSLAEASRRLSELGVLCHFFSFDPAHDAIACRELERSGSEVIRWNPRESPESFVSMLARCRVLLTMRAHGVLFAWSMGIPAVPIIVEPKLLAFANRYAPGHPCLSVNCSVADIVQAALRVPYLPNTSLNGPSQAREARLLAEESASLLDWLSS